MDRKRFISQLEQALEVSPGTLREEEKIRDLEHWDSLRLLQILIFTEEYLGIEIDEDRLAKCVTFGDVLTLAEEIEAARDVENQARPLPHTARRPKHNG